MEESGEFFSIETDELSSPYLSLHPAPLIVYPPSREDIFNSSNPVAPNPSQGSTASPVAVAGSSPGRLLHTTYRSPESCEPVHFEVPQSSGLYPQTGHPRRDSDSSSDGHTPEEEASPEGSPKEKYVVPTGATWDMVNARFRDKQRPTPSRLETFWNWNSPYPAERLAAAGFIYEGIRDQVRCTGCRKTLEGWTLTDDPYVEHRNIYGYECFKL